MEKRLFPNGLNSNQIKVIAIIAMLFNHIYHVFMRSPYLDLFNTDSFTLNMLMSLMRISFRYIGSITFMLMIFMLVEGFEKTKNRIKYARRLFLFSVISFVPFSLFATSRFFDGNIRPFLSVERFFSMVQGRSFIDAVFIYMALPVFSVIFTLCCGFLMLMLIENAKNKIEEIGILLFFIIISYPSDWGGIGVMGIYVMHKLPRNNRALWGVIYFFIIAIINATIIDIYFSGWVNGIPEKIINYAVSYSLMLLCIPILDRYNEEKGKRDLKYTFYIFYPLHMMVLFFIYIFIFYFLV